MGRVNRDARCEQCPQALLEQQRETRLGKLATRCIELIGISEAGVTITLDDLTAEEAQALPIVKAELERWRAAQQPKS